MLEIRLRSSCIALALASGIILAASVLSSDPAQAQSSNAAADVRAQANERAGAIALTAAEESLVLLKNDGVLPLVDDAIEIAVIGPFGDATRVLRGNYFGTISVPPQASACPHAAAP